ncbi:MAG: 3-dehydroquinate synthase [Bacteroides sp.]|nr:3-dehydroquinate synthase [Bacillota bacterium]MCM1393673.1 3-dehydroquinate synthase [[Eubacterium] siraeum]MCM1455228.1 3-dehydroquinate synthase [Bacteroides sp.]
MSSIEVKVNSPYSILIERGALARLGEELKKVTRANKILVVTDTNVQKLYLESAKRSLAGYEVHSFVFEAGERSKTAETYLGIISALGESGFKRTDAVVALGGGVVGDVAGFAAATYMRGIDVVQVPTTLLAMIDSSIGGKTGVDLPFGKNLLGAFYQPKLVLADIAALDTLPEKEWENGIGEGIKYACLAGGKIYDILKDGLDNGNLEEFVRLCAKYKADIVAEDEKESGLRKLLNLGHTLGHAIEKQSDFEVSHGVAVAKGIAVMAHAALRYGELSKDDCDRIDGLLLKYGFGEMPRIDKSVMSLVAVDKKAEGSNEISVVTLRGMGNPAVKKLTFDSFESYIGII